MVPAMQLRRLTPEDVLPAARLTSVAFGGGPREGRIRRYLTLEPEGWFTVEEAGALLAVGGVVRFGPLAWLGLMAVEPGRQREGLGRTIAEAAIGWARSQGCTTVLLIATAAGIPLYRRLGFVDDGDSSELAGVPEISRPAAGPGIVRPWKPEDTEEVARFDAPAFGADRGRLLAAYAREFDGSAWVARDVRGAMRGFLVVQGETLGPWSATDETVAAQLLDTGLGDVRRSLRIGIVDALGERLLEARGLKRTRSLPRMRLGPALPRGSSPRLLAYASYAVG
jgi:GNAT superfamily N-acetyltransferase